MKIEIVKTVIRVLMVLEWLHASKSVMVGLLLETRAIQALGQRTKPTTARAPISFRAWTVASTIPSLGRTSLRHEWQRWLWFIAWRQDLDIQLLQRCLFAQGVHSPDSH